MGKKLILGAILVLSLTVAGKGLAAEKGCAALPPADEKAIKENPDVYKDLGAYRVIEIHGKAAIEMLKRTDGQNVLMDREKKVIIILVPDMGV